MDMIIFLCAKVSEIDGKSLMKGPSRAFLVFGICHFFRQDIGKVGFEIVGNGMRYIHGNKNFLIFLYSVIGENIK